MSIAAALNILVTAPRAQLQQDLKAIGSTFGQLKATVAQAMKGAEQSVADVERQIEELGLAWQRGVLDATTYFREVQRLQQQSHQVGKIDDVRPAFTADEEKAARERLAAEQSLRAQREAAYNDLGKQELAQIEKEKQARLTAAAQLKTQREAAYNAAGAKEYADKQKMLADAVAHAREQQALFNQQVARANQLYANVSPLATLNLKLREYDALLKANAMTLTQHTALVRQANREYWQQTTVLGRAFGSMSKLASATGLSNPYLALVSVLGVVTREFMHFDRNLAATAAVSNLTAEEYQALRVSALEMGSDARFSASKVAEAQKLLAQAGLDGNEVIQAQGALLDLAVAGEMDLANATEIAVRAMGAFELDATQLSDVVDALAVGANESVASVESLGEGLKFVGPLAHQAGISMEETVAALMVLSDKGLGGEMGGTGLRNMFARLAAPTEGAAEAMDRYGIKLKRTEEGALDLLSIVEQMHAVLENMAGPDQLKFLSEIGKTRSANIMSALFADPEKLKAAVGKQKDNEGAGSEMAEKMQQNVWDDLREVWNTLVTSLVDVFEALYPIIRILTVSLKNLANVVSMFALGLKTMANLVYLSLVWMAQQFVKLAAWLTSFVPGSGVSEKLSKLDKSLGNTVEGIYGGMVKDGERMQGLFVENLENMGVNLPGGEDEKDKDGKGKKPKNQWTEAELAAEELRQAATGDAQKMKADLEDQIKYLGVSEDLTARLRLLNAGVDSSLVHQISLLQKQVAQKKLLVEADETIQKAVEQAKYFGMNGLEIEAAKAREYLNQLAFVGQNTQAYREQLALVTQLDDKARQLADAERQKEEKQLFSKSDDSLEQLKLENEIWRTEQRKADEYDRMLAAAKKLGAGAYAQMEVDVRRLRNLEAQNKLYEEQEKQLEKQREDQAKAMDGLYKKADEARKQADPFADFKSQYAELSAAFVVGALDPADYQASVEQLQNKFVQSGSARTVAPTAIEQGSQEEFKLLHGSPVLEVNKQQLRQLQSSNATLDLIHTELRNAGMDQVLPIPPP